MAETVLITKADVEEVRDINKLYNQSRFETFAKEVQRVNLRDLLGSAMYYDFFENIAVQKYVDLLDGKTYEYNGETIQYYGLKPLLVYWWLALNIREGSLFIGKQGVVEFTDNPQQHYKASAIASSIGKDYLGSAIIYSNNVKQFLDCHSSDYDLWDVKPKQKRTRYRRISSKR